MVSTTSKNRLPAITIATFNLNIPQSAGQIGAQDFDFDEVFGPQTNRHHPLSSSSSSSPSSSSSSTYPEIIHNRSHSLVGPSPRFAPDVRLNPLAFDSDPHCRHVAVSIPEGPDSGSTEKIMAMETTEEEEEFDRGVAEKIGANDFEILRVVGQGAFGKVFQVRRKSLCSEIYAMKVMRKDVIIKKNHVEYMKSERDILSKVIHPFVVQLRYSFQTKSKLYLILDFINGGHLFFQLYRQGTFSEDQARFYTAEIVSAVSHLHKCGIVHRDLKPENILMDADGHVMLTDFGLAKEIDESSRSNSMCGTTEYMAPEIILSKGHNKDADWWSVGILLYEMLTGQPPFTHTNRQKLQQRIIKEKVKLPSYLSSDTHSLLKGLLQKEPLRRLGSGVDGGDEIKKHKWFKQINWDKLEARELQPKFKPDVSGRDCTANFDTCWTVMPPDDSPAPTPTAGDHFQGYTYVPPNPWLSDH